MPPRGGGRLFTHVQQHQRPPPRPAASVTICYPSDATQSKPFKQKAGEGGPTSRSLTIRATCTGRHPALWWRVSFSALLPATWIHHPHAGMDLEGRRRGIAAAGQSVATAAANEALKAMRKKKVGARPVDVKKRCAEE